MELGCSQIEVFNSVYSHILNYLRRDPRGNFSFERNASTQSFPLPCLTHRSSQHIRIKENKACEAFLTKSCSCHNKDATDHDNDDDECKEFIKPIIGQLYHVKYNLLLQKYCLLWFHKMTLKNIYLHLSEQSGKTSIPLILPIKPGFIKIMLCNCQLFQILPDKESTNGNKNYCKRRDSQQVSMSKDFPEDLFQRLFIYSNYENSQKNDFLYC